jgi:hypothetical protein
MSGHRWDLPDTAAFRAAEQANRIWWQAWERAHPPPPPPPPTVCMCGARIRPCRCVAHPPPLWRHSATGRHHCTSGRRAEPFWRAEL